MGGGAGGESMAAVEGVGCGRQREVGRRCQQQADELGAEFGASQGSQHDAVGPALGSVPPAAKWLCVIAVTLRGLMNDRLCEVSAASTPRAVHPGRRSQNSPHNRAVLRDGPAKP
nr:hypothetical protein GCM10010200_035650 [Actinomadura rugatobispora]